MTFADKVADHGKEAGAGNHTGGNIAKELLFIQSQLFPDGGHCLLLLGLRFFVQKGLFLQQKLVEFLAIEQEMGKFTFKQWIPG